jgi:DNA modification methylase
MKNYGGKRHQIGFGQSKEDYLLEIEKILQVCFEITKETGSLWLVADSFRRKGILELLPLELATRASKVGWKLKEHITWDKQYSLPWHGRGQMRDVSESILFFVKSSEYKYYPNRVKTLDEISKWWVDFPERFNPKGKTPTNIWRYPIRRRGTWPKPSVINHLCPFPSALVARIIELTTNENDLVLDPFAGSGVVPAQAGAMRRRYLGFELNRSYVRMYEKHVRKQIAKEWEELKDWRKKIKHSNVNFEQTILKLRALKFSRKVSQAFISALPKKQSNKVKAVLCLAEIPRSHRSGKFMKIQVWILGERNHKIFKRGLAAAKRSINKPPLSHYEITATIDAGRYIDFIKHIPNKEAKSVYYLYPTQQPRGYTEARVLKAWFDRDQISQIANGNGTPPLLANVAEDVSWVIDK